MDNKKGRLNRSLVAFILETAALSFMCWVAAAGAQLIVAPGVQAIYLLFLGIVYVAGFILAFINTLADTIKNWIRTGDPENSD